MSKRNMIIGAVAILIAAAAWFFSRQLHQENYYPENTIVLAEDTVVLPNMDYGLVLDSFEVIRSTIQKNEFLADILLKYDVSYPTIEKIAATPDSIFNVRRIKSGRPYAVFMSLDSLRSAEYFVYEKDPLNYVVFDLRDSVIAMPGQREVRVVRREAGGIIYSSLFESLMEQELSPALAMNLSDIYAWSIDFYRIQKGDAFKVIFDEKYVGDEFIGIGQVYASLFVHGGEDFYGFAYPNENDRIEYYDEEANSLRKAFLQSPIKFGRISSGFTMRRYHPVQKRYKAHLGTDYAAPTGTPIYSVGDGTVIEARFKRYNGNYVKIRHNSVYTTQYLHMSKIASGMTPGKVVKQGDIIGYVGSTGLATGPHVCFRFWKNGKQVNHRAEKLPSAEPIAESQREAYNIKMAELKSAIDSIEIMVEAPEQAQN